MGPTTDVSEENHDNSPPVVRKIWPARKTEGDSDYEYVAMRKGRLRMPERGRMIPS